MNGYLLALDQGTTSSRAILFDVAGNAVVKAQYPLKQIYPRPGWVEHDPEEILATQLHALAEVYEKSGVRLEPEVIILPPDYKLEDHSPKALRNHVTINADYEETSEK